jgi:hypothetical protein
MQMSHNRVMLVTLPAPTLIDTNRRDPNRP